MFPLCFSSLVWFDGTVGGLVICINTLSVTYLVNALRIMSYVILLRGIIISYSYRDIFRSHFLISYKVIEKKKHLHDSTCKESVLIDLGKYIYYRSSHHRCSIKKDVLRNQVCNFIKKAAEP